MDNKSLLIGLERFSVCFASYSNAIKEDARAKNIDVASRVSGSLTDGSATFAKCSIKTSEAKLKISGQLPLNFKDLEDYECDDVTFVMLDGKELTGTEKYNVAMSAILKDLIEYEFNAAKITERHTETTENDGKRYVTDYYKAKLSDGTSKIKCENKYLASENTIKALNVIENYVCGSFATKIGDMDVTVSDKDLEWFRKGEFSKSRWAEFSEGLVVVLKGHVTTKVGEVSKREVKYSYRHYSMIDRDFTVDNKPAAEECQAAQCPAEECPAEECRIPSRRRMPSSSKK